MTWLVLMVGILKEIQGQSIHDAGLASHAICVT